MGARTGFFLTFLCGGIGSLLLYSFAVRAQWRPDTVCERRTLG